MTLFANILQNPQDARARGDLKLMSSVCSFLTMLERDIVESNGNVKRMLSVCSEFERIARVVLDKAESEMRGGRGKRKPTEREKAAAAKHRAASNDEVVERGLEEGKSLEQIQVETQANYRRPVQTPSLRFSQNGSATGESPASWAASPVGGHGPEYHTPQHGHSLSVEGGQQSHPRGQSRSPNQWHPSAPGMPNASLPQQDFGTGTYTTQPGVMGGAFGPNASNGFNNGPTLSGMDPSTGFEQSPDILNGTGSFQQPFVPQDLWQMPMTLEWDWAEGLGLGSFTPGPMFDVYGMGDTGVQDSIGGQQQHMQ